jgi:hypothetical protein
MPRYFFDVADSAKVPDEVGTELPGLQAARIEAARLAGRLLADQPEMFWSGEEWQVAVRDETGLVLFTVNFTATDAPSR